MDEFFSLFLNIAIAFGVFNTNLVKACAEGPAS